MGVSTRALEVLEFQAVCEKLAGHTQSAIATAWARELQPDFQEASMRAALVKTQEAADYLNRDLLPSAVGLRDVRQAVQRSAKGGVADGESLFQVGEALVTMRELRTALGSLATGPNLRALADQLPLLEGLGDRLLASLEPDGLVRDGASQALTQLRQKIRKTTQRLSDRIQSYTNGSKREYLSDPIVTQRSGRYVVPVKSEHRGKIPGLVHDTSASGQTVFVEPMDVVELGNAVREAEAAERAEVQRILAELSSRVGDVAPQILTGLEVGATIDLIFARARYGLAEDGSVPEAAPPGSVRIEMGRHPLLDRKIAVPLSFALEGDTTGVLITGPNTGGKTVAMKTVGLFLLMAHCGMMVPARSAHVGSFDTVWADIGDEQSLQQSLSTFSGHIRNIGEALRNLRPNALVILDEVGAGTDPGEGAALAKAVLLTIQQSGAKVLASTHYGELKLFAANTPGFINASMEFDLQSLRPTYRLLMGTPGASHAFRVAERVGLPKQVVELAREHTGADEQDVARMVDQLEQAQRRAHKAQSEADRLAHQLRKLEGEVESKLAEAKEAKRKARQEAAEEVEQTLRTIRLQAADLFESLKLKGKTVATERERQLLKSLTEQGAELSDRLKPVRTEPLDVITKGSSVKVVGTSQVGTVIDEPSGDKARVQIGAIKMTVALQQLQLVAGTQKVVPQRAARTNVQLEKMDTTRMELNIIGMRAEIAEPKINRFLDDASLAGYPSVRIVHGKGNGILRALTRQLAGAHPGVDSFKDAEPQEGGHGATIVTLG